MVHVCSLKPYKHKVDIGTMNYFNKLTSTLKKARIIYCKNLYMYMGTSRSDRFSKLPND